MRVTLLTLVCSCCRLTASMNVASIKGELRLIAARSNRGFSASPDAISNLRRLTESLEASFDGEAEQPTSSPLLPGKWSLDFCDAADVLSLGLLPLPLTIGDIFQEVTPMADSPDTFVVNNGVEILPPGAGVLGALTQQQLSGLYAVEARCKALSPTKVSLLFVGGRVQPLVTPLAMPAVGGALPDALIEGLQGIVGERVFLETTYLDEDLRVGRGPSRELYVLSKR